MLSSVAYLIVIPTIFLSIMLPPPMSPTFSHLSLNGNLLAKLGIIRPALGESFGLITQLSLPSPLEVRSTIIVTTSQSLKISLNMFKRRSLTILTLIGTSLSFTRPSLLLSFIATKQSGGSLPTISMGSFKSARLLHFFSPYGTTNEVFRRRLKTLLDGLPLPWNLPFRWLRASPHHSVTPILKRNAANGSHILCILNVSPWPPILTRIFLLCRSAGGYYRYAVFSSSSPLYIGGSHCSHCGYSHSLTGNSGSLPSLFGFFCSASTTYQCTRRHGD